MLFYLVPTKRASDSCTILWALGYVNDTIEFIGTSGCNMSLYECSVN